MAHSGRPRRMWYCECKNHGNRYDGCNLNSGDCCDCGPDPERMLLARQLVLINPDLRSRGAHPPSGVAGRALAASMGSVPGMESDSELFCAPGVFREGAENSTRGRVRSLSCFGVRANLNLSAMFELPADHDSRSERLLLGN